MCTLVKINYFSNIRKIVNFFFLYFDLFFRGKVVCDNILCPNPTCAQPFLPEGECCPICNNTVKAIQPGNKKEWNWFDEKKKSVFIFHEKKLPNLEFVYSSQDLVAIWKVIQCFILQDQDGILIFLHMDSVVVLRALVW